jgi:hypothetical protein
MAGVSDTVLAGALLAVALTLVVGLLSDEWRPAPVRAPQGRCAPVPLGHAAAAREHPAVMTL